MAKLKFDDEDTFDIGFNDNQNTEVKEFDVGTVVEIPIELIDIGENIRNVNDDDESKLRQLGDSIKADGQIEPCIVYQSADRYVLKAGSRRYKACLLCDVPTLKCIIDKKFENERERIIYQATENEHRDNMNPRERENYMARLIELGMSQIEIAKALHKNKGWVSEALTAYNTLEENSELKEVIDENVSTRDLWKASKLEKDEFEVLKNAVKTKGGDKKTFKEELKKVQPKKEVEPEINEEEKEAENSEVNKIFGIDFDVDNSADDTTDENTEEFDTSSDEEEKPLIKKEYTVNFELSFLIDEEHKKAKYTGTQNSEFEKFIVNQAKNFYIEKGYVID